jgi:hypothetical protein
MQVISKSVHILTSQAFEINACMHTAYLFHIWTICLGRHLTDPLWEPFGTLGLRMEPYWNPNGTPVEPLWNPSTHVEPLWNPCGTPVEPLGAQYNTWGSPVNPTAPRRTFGFVMEPCGFPQNPGVLQRTPVEPLWHPFGTLIQSVEPLGAQ